MGFTVLFSQDKVAPPTKIMMFDLLNEIHQVVVTENYNLFICFGFFSFDNKQFNFNKKLEKLT
jgi:hypothetical protein